MFKCINGNEIHILFRDWRIKMRYVLFDKNEKDWQMVYCTQDNDEESLLENISKAMLRGNEFEKFNAKDAVCMNDGGIKNDSMIFSINECGVRYIWQLGSKVSDMTDFIIPHLYRVRKIGMIV